MRRRQLALALLAATALASCFDPPARHNRDAAGQGGVIGTAGEGGGPAGAGGGGTSGSGGAGAGGRGGDANVGGRGGDAGVGGRGGDTGVGGRGGDAGVGGRGGDAGVGGRGGDAGVGGRGGDAGVGGRGGQSGGGGRGGAAFGGRGGSFQCSVNVLINGGFDDGGLGWTANPTNRPLIYNEDIVDPFIVPPPHSGRGLAWLGNDVVSGTVTLSQDFMVPSDALSITVTGYIWIRSNDGTSMAYDFAQLELLNANTTIPLRTIPWSNVDSNVERWSMFINGISGTDAASFVNTTATFRIKVTMDDAFTTDFFFDSLSLYINRCP